MSNDIKMLFMISGLLCYLMINMSHPIMMVLLIGLQTLVICTSLSMMIQVSWFSYILFLVFIGGLMVLFIYISSLASNENLLPNLKVSSTNLLMVSLFFILMSPNLNYQLPQSLNSMVKLMIFKIYAPEMVMITFITMLYLLLTLLIVVNMAMMKEGSLRPMKF